MKLICFEERPSRRKTSIRFLDMTPVCVLAVLRYRCALQLLTEAFYQPCSAFARFEERPRAARFKKTPIADFTSYG
jgi:hypothetical protein